MYCLPSGETVNQMEDAIVDYIPGETGSQTRDSVDAYHGRLAIKQSESIYNQTSASLDRLTFPPPAMKTNDGRF